MLFLLLLLSSLSSFAQEKQESKSGAPVPTVNPQTRPIMLTTFGVRGNLLNFVVNEPEGFDLATSTVNSPNNFFVTRPTIALIVQPLYGSRHQFEIVKLDVNVSSSNFNSTSILLGYQLDGFFGRFKTAKNKTRFYIGPYVRAGFESVKRTTSYFQNNRITLDSVKGIDSFFTLHRSLVSESNSYQRLVAEAGVHIGFRHKLSEKFALEADLYKKLFFLSSGTSYINGADPYSNSVLTGPDKTGFYLKLGLSYLFY